MNAHSRRQYAKLGREMHRDKEIWRIMRSSILTMFWPDGLLIASTVSGIAIFIFFVFGGLNAATALGSALGAFLITLTVCLIEQVNLFAENIDDWIHIRTTS